jgi:hypothetical protein
MFTLRANLEKRLNYVCQAIFKYFAEKNIVNILSFTETYSTQHIYAFKMYRMSERYFMVNNSQTQAYLIDENGIDRDGVDAIKARFWG